MKKFLALAVAIIAFGTAFAQQKDVPFEKDFFKDKKSEFKDALKNYKAGIEMMEPRDPSIAPNYEMAIKLFKPAYQFNPNSADLNYRMGICYIYSKDKFESLDYFSKAYELRPTVNKMIHYYLGWANHLQFAFDKGLYHYKLYRNTLNQKDDLDLIAMVGKRIDECNYGLELIEEPIRVWIDNLGPAVNSKYPDYSPMISADESLIMITTRRPSTVGEGIDPQDQMYFEDIAFSDRVDNKSKWAKAVGLDGRINTKSHDATAGLSHDGSTLFIFYGHEGMGDIYVSYKEKDGWSKAKSVGKKINGKKSWETAACLSYDKKELFFVSNREGTLGERDIWVSKWDEDKEEWMDPSNLGPTINTPYDEAGIYVHPDGRSIYFSSKGHNSMGGFDIFKAVKDDNGVWQKPENIGFPVSTPDDDVHFVISASGKHGYYSSFKNDGFGEKDIYMITFLGEEKQPLLQSEDNLLASVTEPIKEKVKMPKVKVTESSLAILKGIIRDEKTQKPLLASIELVDNEKGTIIQTFKSDPSTGKYLVSLPSGKNYGIAVKSDGYLFHSENFDIPRSSGYKEYEKNVDLKKPEVGKAIVLRNIFFDLDKATLRPESKTELERLNKLMVENPTLKIELSGHTDTRGSDSHNQDLSERRAKAVVDYLVKKGISAGRMKHAGYGETKTIISDADIAKLPTKDQREEAHQQNRRTEFKILSL